MSFLAFLAVAASVAYGLSTAASEVKTASCKSELNKEQYSLKQFETILRLLRIKRVKIDGFYILPPFSDHDYSIKQYIAEQPLTDENDFEEFKEHYIFVRDLELNNLYEFWDTNYNNAYGEYLASKSDDDPIVVIKKKHYAFEINGGEEEIRERAFEVYWNTFLGEMAVKPPKVVKNQHTTNESWYEIWALKCSGGSLKANEYYKVCNNKLHYVVD